jgi:hypothetical protein
MHALRASAIGCIRVQILLSYLCHGVVQEMLNKDATIFYETTTATNTMKLFFTSVRRLCFYA